mmetsp:Transcript_136004/g.352617  ORF Transcript_136004/g.352617 Transcript_136004/m.352617 type:complete len:849 (+) Transcript_136004:47-2593(+)
MSELLQNWLNNEVGLSTNVANFEKDFSSGYLFGEVLHKFRQQDDFEQFVNKNTYEAKLANFKKLEPTLKALGIRVDATHSNAMMNCERGASLRLLYQLKMATERLLLSSDAGAGAAALAKGRGGGGSAAGATLGAEVTKGIRVPREKFDAHERRFFEHRLRATCPNAKQDRIKKVEHKFQQEMHKQEALAFHMDNLEQAHIAEQREIHRFGLRERLRQNKFAKDDWTRAGIDMWGKNMQRRADREAFDVSFANRVQQKQQDKIQKARSMASSEVRNGVDAFESGLTSLGLTRPRERRAGQPDADSDSSEGSDASELQADRLLNATTPAANARELVDALQARMPNAEELEQEAGLFLQKIKESKRAGSIARKERERRRRRVLVEQQREQDLLEESKLEDVLLEKLSRQSIEEKSISYSVWKTQRYEDVIVRNRQLRQQEYTARRKEDIREALRRDQDLREEMLQTVRQQEERERQRYRAIERGRQANRRAGLSEECERILELVAGMAFAAMEQEQLTDSPEVDPTLWRGWTALFVDNVPVESSESILTSKQTMYPLTALPPELQAPEGSEKTLDEAAFKDYVGGVGQWASQDVDLSGSGEASAPFDPSAEAAQALELAADVSFAEKLSAEVDVVGTRPVNYRLGSIVASLLDRKYKEPPLPDPPAMPAVPLKLVITGRPFAGKKTVAARLAESYNLQVIDVDEVLHECLMLSKRPDRSTPPINVLSFTTGFMDEHCQKHSDGGNPYLKQLQDIGYEVQEVLDRGESLSDELYVQLIVTKIRSLFPQDIPAQDPVDAGTKDDANAADADATADPAEDADAAAAPASASDGPGTGDPAETDATAAAAAAAG